MINQELILYEKKGRIATITINRPNKAHAFNIEMLKTMYEKLNDADKDDKIKCILMKSSGQKFFSAGYDLKEAFSDHIKVAQIKEWGRKINESMILMKKPIVTQIQGIAIGFGFMIILASDLRIFADRPKEELYLKLPEIEISAFPQTGATILPLLAFGLSYAKNILYTADKIGVKELSNINFPTRIFPLEDLETETLSFVKQLSKYQTEFLFFIKSMLTIMNKDYIKSCFDLEDECGNVAYATKKRSMQELDNFIKDLYEKYA